MNWVLARNMYMIIQYASRIASVFAGSKDATLRNSNTWSLSTFYAMNPTILDFISTNYSDNLVA